MTELQRIERSALDCRLCHYFTTKTVGCTSVVLCVDANRYTPTTPRQYWKLASDAETVIEHGTNVGIEPPYSVGSNDGLGL